MVDSITLDPVTVRATPTPSRGPPPGAVEHLRAAHDELEKLPPRVQDEAEHSERVRNMRGHVKACSKYLDFYDTTGPGDGLGLDPPDNPEGERARAAAAAVLAGFGRAPRRSRH
jgi:hypothetical protein